jgi:hypothetical protein
LRTHSNRLTSAGCPPSTSASYSTCSSGGRRYAKASDNEFGAVSCPIDTADWAFDLAAFVQIDLTTMKPRVAFILPAAVIPSPKFNGAGARRVWGTKVFANRNYPEKVDLLPGLLALLDSHL